MQNFNYSVTLSVIHPHFDLAAITDVLRLQPTRHPTQAGELRKMQDGTPLPGQYVLSHWMHSFGDRDDEQLVPFLRNICDCLSPHRDFLGQIVDEGGNVELFIAVFTDTNCDQILPFTLLRDFGELKIDLRLDLYGTNLRQVNHPPVADDSNPP